MTGPFPYAEAAHDYLRAGWVSPLPLPPNAKSPPPTGYTGFRAEIPSPADVQTWVETQGDGNIAVRLAPGIIGIDVDHYKGKGGGDTLAALEAEHGPLPATAMSTARPLPSGIRYFRVPTDVPAWKGAAGPGIEVVHFGHRFAVVPPSMHPDVGEPYRWVQSHTGEALPADYAPPGIDALPELPAAWVAYLRRETGGAAKGALDDEATREWLEALPVGDACDIVLDAVTEFVRDLDDPPKDRHDVMNEHVGRIMRLGEAEHTGVYEALRQLAPVFIETVQDSRPGGADDAQGEWWRSVVGAKSMIDETPSDRSCMCNSYIIEGYDHVSLGSGIPPVAATPTAPEPAFAAPGQEGDEATGPDRDTETGNPLARMATGGTFIFDQPTELPALWGEGDEVLWAEGEALVLFGPEGTGKTTIGLQVVRGRLGLVDEVLGYPVVPDDRPLLYLAMDRPRQIARTMRRLFSANDRAELDERLLVWQGPLPNIIDHDPEMIRRLAQHYGAGTVVVDSIKDLTPTIDKPESSAAVNRARQECVAEGIEVVELHHPRKSDGGTQRIGIDELYGGRWVAAGAGSIVQIAGKPGDESVRLHHVKQPAGKVGPLNVRHNHDTGVSKVVVADEGAPSQYGDKVVEAMEAITTMAHHLPGKTIPSTRALRECTGKNSVLDEARDHLVELGRLVVVPAEGRQGGGGFSYRLVGGPWTRAEEHAGGMILVENEGE